MSDGASRLAGGAPSLLLLVGGVLLYSLYRSQQESRLYLQSKESKSDALKLQRDREEEERASERMFARERFRFDAAAGASRSDQQKWAIVVVGPLGSGKTTLVANFIRASRDFTLGVLVNDFAPFNVDAADLALLETDDATTAVRGLSGDCVCCASSFTEFETIVKEIGPKYDALLVETSGVSDASRARARLLQSNGGRFRVWVVGVVDAETFPPAHWSREDLAQFVRTCDVVVLNKTDLVSPDTVSELTRRVRGDESRVRVRSVSLAKTRSIASRLVDLTKIFPVSSLQPEREAFGRTIKSSESRVLERFSLRDVESEEEAGLAPAPSHTGHQHLPANSVESILWEDEQNPVSLADLQRVLAESPGLVRAKGTVWLREMPRTRVSLQLSGKRRADLEPHGAWIGPARTKIVLLFDSSVFNAQKYDYRSLLGSSKKDNASMAASPSLLERELRATKAFEVEPKAPGDSCLSFRLTCFHVYGFGEEDLFSRFGVSLYTVNRDVQLRFSLPTTLALVAFDGERLLVVDTSEEAVVEGLKRVAADVVNDRFALVAHAKCDV